MQLISESLKKANTNIWSLPSKGLIKLIKNLCKQESALKLIVFVPQANGLAQPYFLHWILNRAESQPCEVTFWISMRSMACYIDLYYATYICIYIFVSMLILALVYSRSFHSVHYLLTDNQLNKAHSIWFLEFSARNLLQSSTHLNIIHTQHQQPMGNYANWKSSDGCVNQVGRRVVWICLFVIDFHWNWVCCYYIKVRPFIKLWL